MHGLQAFADMALAAGKALHRRLHSADEHLDLLSHHQLQAFLPRLQDNVNEFLAATNKLSASAAALAAEFAEVLSHDGGGDLFFSAATSAVELQVSCKAAADAHSAMASKFVLSPFLRDIQVPSQLQQELAMDPSRPLGVAVHKQLKMVNAERRCAVRELFQGLLRLQLEWARSSTTALEQAIRSAEAASHEAAALKVSCRDLWIDGNGGLLATSGGVTPGGDESEPPSTTASVAQDTDLYDFNEEAVEAPEGSEPPSTTASVAQIPDLWDCSEVAAEDPEINLLAASHLPQSIVDHPVQEDLLEFNHGEHEKTQSIDNSEEAVAHVQMRVLEWQRGKNLRALLASLHHILPTQTWEEKSLSKLLDPLAVQEAYKAASAVVDADQHSDSQLLSKSLMIELSQVLGNAWHAFILELVSSGLEVDCDSLKKEIAMRVQQWKQGKNIRTLLASLHEVTPPQHWAVRTTSDMPDTTALKNVYKAALLIVHPDKRVLPKALAEPVFHTLQDAWDISKQGRAW